MTAIVSHRGGAALWPENSLLAFRGTLALDVDQVEFDVRLSRDGVPVVFHDATLVRMTGAEGPLADRTLDELRELRLRDTGERIPTLDETLDVLGAGAPLLRCELKSDAGAAPSDALLEATLSRLEARGLVERTIFTTFHLPSVARLALRAPDAHGYAWLVGRACAAQLGAGLLASLAERVGLRALSLHRSALDAHVLAAFDAAGVEVGVFGALEDEAIEKTLRLGPALLTADRPDAALRIRERLARANGIAARDASDGDVRRGRT